MSALALFGTFSFSQTDGGLVQAAECRFIEFFKLEEDDEQ